MATNHKPRKRTNQKQNPPKLKNKYQEVHFGAEKCRFLKKKLDLLSPTFA